jgi:hypothetical protein
MACHLFLADVKKVTSMPAQAFFQSSMHMSQNLVFLELSSYLAHPVLMFVNWYRIGVSSVVAHTECSRSF